MQVLSYTKNTNLLSDRLVFIEIKSPHLLRELTSQAP